MKKNSFVILIVVFIGYSCSRSKPIDDKKMIKIMYELNLQNEYFKSYSYLDSISQLPTYQNFVFQKILQKNNVSVTDYEKTLQYFYKNPTKFKVFTDSLYQYAEIQEKEIENKNQPLKPPDKLSKRNKIWDFKKN
ncbi:MAG: DUF4296 domain-containing protein [Sediminibacterium sp.]|nr:DUF4296 domain-containing protein [Sediminibacterium sp.]